MREERGSILIRQSFYQCPIVFFIHLFAGFCWCSCPNAILSCRHPLSPPIQSQALRKSCFGSGWYHCRFTSKHRIPLQMSTKKSYISVKKMLSFSLLCSFATVIIVHFSISDQGSGPFLRIVMLETIVTTFLRK